MGAYNRHARLYPEKKGEVMNRHDQNLRELMEYTRKIPISEGGLATLIERMVSEIEIMQERVSKLESQLNEGLNH